MLRRTALVLTSGLAGCASVLDHPDLRLRNDDDTEHDLSVEIISDDAEETVLSGTFTLTPETGDTTLGSLFSEGHHYRVTASIDAGDPRSTIWRIEGSNPTYHVTIHGADEGDRGEPSLSMGRLGGP